MHKEKQEAVMKLNEENRRIYYENNNLRLKISELSRVIDRNSSMMM